jgi:hypothetical protein
MITLVKTMALKGALVGKTFLVAVFLTFWNFDVSPQLM